MVQLTDKKSGVFGITIIKIYRNNDLKNIWGGWKEIVGIG